MNYINDIILKNENNELKELKDYFSIHYNCKNYIHNYIYFQPNAFQLRETVLEWLYNINQKLKESESTLIKAINLYDDYLMREKHDKLQKRKYTFD